MEQEIFNWAIAITGILGGWVLKTIWSSVKDLQNADKEIIDRVAAVEVLVAGKYVTREDFEKVVDRLFTKLDAISDQVGKKADR